MSDLAERVAGTLLSAALPPVQKALRDIFEEVKGPDYNAKPRRLVLTFEVAPTRDELGISMFCQAEFAAKKVLYHDEVRIESNWTAR